MLRTARRTFLKVSGSVIGDTAVGTTVTAAERTDRYIVLNRRNADLSEALAEPSETIELVTLSPTGVQDGQRISATCYFRVKDWSVET